MDPDLMETATEVATIMGGSLSGLIEDALKRELQRIRKTPTFREKVEERSARLLGQD